MDLKEELLEGERFYFYLGERVSSVNGSSIEAIKYIISAQLSTIAWKSREL